MKKLLAGTTAGVMVAATMWVGGTGSARADYGSDRVALCGNAAVDVCSITIRNNDPYMLTEGVGSAIVDVVGKAGVTSKLQLYAMIPSEYPYNWDAVDALGSPIAFTTNASGKKTLTIPIPVLPAPHGATSVISFQLVGATQDTTRDNPIARIDDGGAPDTIRVRSARGADMNALTTVRDGSLEAEVGGGITGQVYGVQIQVKGTWTDITDRARPGNGVVDVDGYAVVHADVSGYPDASYSMRLFNRTLGIYDLKLFAFQGSVSLVKNVYITPGEHVSGGRKWRTTCEAYSQTQRCRTEIWATTADFKAGKLVKRTGWVFNNLTYKESARALWKNNPLGNKGTYTINGREWRTECDTPATGGNGCRSFLVATVVESYRSGGKWKYRQVTKEVFNNIVMFTSTD